MTRDEETRMKTYENDNENGNIKNWRIMKAKDFMIGDWVGIEYYATGVAIDGVIKAEKKIMPCNVSRIEDYIVTLDRPDGKIQDCLVADLIPIPLTAEILEKNSYHYEETCGIKQLYSEDGRVLFTSDPNYLNSQNVWSMHIDSEDMSTIGCVELTYVHEFQHMLRLCGIEKEIEL